MSGEHKSELMKRDKTEEKLKKSNDDLKRSNELLQEKFKEQLDKTKKQKTTIDRLETELEKLRNTTNAGDGNSKDKNKNNFWYNNHAFELGGN